MATKLSKENFEKAKSYIMERGRVLDQARFDYYFQGGSKENVLSVLRSHQNPDGGFQDTGEGPRNVSSPIGTSVAFQLLTELDVPASDTMVKNGVNYLLDTFDRELGLWQPAFNWLHEGENIIQGWANPSAELVGYLCRYQELVPSAFLKLVLDLVERNLMVVERPIGTFPLLCYMRLWKFAPEPLRESLNRILREDVPKVIEVDTLKWPNWCTKPYWFAISPSSPVGDLIKEDVIGNLEFEINNQTEEGFFPPHWHDTDENLWIWRSILAIDVLKALRNYHMIDK